MRLAETIGRWLGRVEVVLSGAEGALREGEQALASGDPMRARAEAHALLERVPGSPLGLALLADACEMAGLEAELALTLEELAIRVASRADVWVRLGRARDTTGAPSEDVRDAYVRALAVAEPGSEARRDALVALADLDLAQGDGARAELWLERIDGTSTAPAKGAPSLGGSGAVPKITGEKAAIALRRAEARLLQGDHAGARAWLDAFESAPTDGRAAFLRGRVLAAEGSAAAFAPLLRAMLLDTPGASEALSSTLAWVPSDEATRARVRLVVEEHKEADIARWRAAFARSEGRTKEARAALRDALSGGDASAARPLLEAALDDRDPEALAQALSALPVVTDDAAIADARRLLQATEPEEPAATKLDALGLVVSARAQRWAGEMRATIVETWIPADGSPADWSALLARLDAHARALHDLELLARVAALSVERTRPVRVAIVGEFNAGKSTFINALIGADVAPTGVLPTTATLHHLRYAPDPIARIIFAQGHEPPERIVAVGDLRATLKGAQHDPIRRVEILLPIASLTRVEILDTPGFNAPDAQHTVGAREAFEEADAAIWLLDAGQALKETERKILAEARAARLPVQMLVNKADRLKPDDLARVMEMVHRSLEEAGLGTQDFSSPPLALSARLALLGKLGDAAALAASGWAAVEELLESQLVARSAELKERALRRRAAQLVVRIAAGAARAAEDEQRELDARAARAQDMAHAAAALDRDAEGAATKIVHALKPAAEAWRRDLTVVVTGRDADAVATDPVLQRYRVDRALARLGAPLAEALSAMHPHATPAALLPMARTLVRPFAATADVGGGGADTLPALARSAVSTLIERLGALGVAQAEPARATGLARELDEIGRALDGFLRPDAAGDPR